MLHFLLNNKLIHLFTNSILLLNYNLLTGYRNKIAGRFGSFFLRFRIRVSGENNVIIINKGCKIKNCKFYIYGNNNSIIIEDEVNLTECVFWISGDENNLEIGRRSSLTRAELGIEHDKGRIIIMKDAYIGGFMQLGNKKNDTAVTHMYTGEGAEIFIREKSYISEGVTFRTSDSHPIYDSENKRINPAKNIVIGENCWICAFSTLMKGAQMGDNSVLGYHSLLNKNLSEYSNVVLTGTPAKVVRENINWERYLKR